MNEKQKSTSKYLIFLELYFSRLLIPTRIEDPSSLSISPVLPRKPQ